jgi:hypothetical protein
MTTKNEDLEAVRRARRFAPERSTAEAVALREGRDLPPDDQDTADTEGADDATLQDWAVAEASRPDLPDETEDGLSDLDEEVRRQAEDR